MKNKELRSLGIEELKEKLLEIRKELIKENAQRATGTSPKNPAKFSNARKTIARILTIIKNDKITKVSEVREKA